MKTKFARCSAAALVAAFLSAEAMAERPESEDVSFTADLVAADSVTKAAVASGHVHAVSGVMSLRGDYMERDAEGTMRFGDTTLATTCTNAPGHTHWGVSGAVEFKPGDHVLLRNGWLYFMEFPVFWLPYLYYPLDTKCGFSWMPGYTGRWGAYLLTKYRYHIAGDTAYGEDTFWLHGATRLDLRTKNGVALGEDLKWNLGGFGGGGLNSYYAWDEQASKNYGGGWGLANWGSMADRHRHLLSLRHDWSPTERDVVRVRASHYSDSYVTMDFGRRSFFNSKTRWLAYTQSGAFWEHLENSFSAGIEVSGRLNDFYGMTGRLPELYFDVNPTPVFGLPANYETRNRIGMLRRDYAKYGAGEASVFGVNPGVWATYDACRFDTYHRLTAPFRTFDDTVSVVPRAGMRATWWEQSGLSDTTGRSRAVDSGNLWRFIGEAGSTFAARGVSTLDGGWRHVVEPYLDVLAQKAWYSGRSSYAREYVFDSLDASLGWEDQFAGRSRNLPYSYFGVTPGFRQTWSEPLENGSMRRVVEFDAYVAAQFNEPTFYGQDENHRLAEPGSPNYGERGCEYVPGARLFWSPTKDVTLGARAEYDSDANRVAYASAGFGHRVNRKFKYNLSFSHRDHRYWDFSSYPFSQKEMMADIQNFANMRIAVLSAEHEICDWLVWSPHVRWDCHDGELDTAGFWIDYLTDCLGFRLLVEYENSFRSIDGHYWDDDWSVGFYIYLRAFGSGDIFSTR